jgi:hypothetical protein
MGIGDLNLSAAGRACEKVEQKPWLEAMLLGGAGAVAGHYGGRMMGKGIMSNVPFVRNIAKDVSPEDREEAIRSLQRMTAVAGGSMAALYAITKHGDFRNMSAFGRSMAKGRPADLTAANAARIRQEAASGQYSHKPFYSGRRYKTATADMYHVRDFAPEFVNPFAHERVPIKHTIDLLNQDPFLTVGQKDFSTHVVQGAEMDGSGLTSGKKLARSALRAGVGFGTAYAFGKTLGNVLSLPKPATERLSRVGGLAAAVVTTGIFEGHRL